MSHYASAIRALAACLCLATGIWAQTSSGTSGSIHGTVLDPDQASIVGATVTVENPVSHYTHSAVTGTDGKYELVNIPYNNYHLTASAPGFQSSSQDVNVRTPVPLEANFALAVGAATTTTVAALRTAVMVAQALTNQKLVSEQVKAVNDTTSAMIESTSAVLREQKAA